VSGHPVYAVARTSAGVSGAAKNLIFAAVKSKPDLYLTDAINNDVSIVNESDALIYDRPLLVDGLKWDDLAQWWAKISEISEITAASKKLYVRLRDAVIASGSPGEYAVFSTYYRQFKDDLGKRLPALIPQVYLHYDPRSKAQRGNKTVLVRQRMDFLMLLPRGVRIVIEIDGKHHYGEGDRVAPMKYAEMAAEDRRLRFQGYEIYRFGAAEFSDTQPDDDAGRLHIGPNSTKLVTAFFKQLFRRHPLPATDLPHSR